MTTERVFLKPKPLPGTDMFFMLNPEGRNRKRKNDRSNTKDEPYNAENGQQLPPVISHRKMKTE